MAESKLITCVDCREPFVFTVGEQDWFKEHNFNDPKRCKECRALAKKAKQ